ncbi:MAG: MBL fold metallo-hydrolase, partial [Candidatus Nanopelagicales bacterium]
MERIALEPVDSVHITTLVDNSSDVLLPNAGLVRRWGLAGSAGEIPVIPTDMAEGGKTFDFLRAEHGFAALIELHASGGRRRVLFDAGMTPDGLIGNLDRLAISPDTFEAIVFSHGHFDHVMGIDGLIDRLGRGEMPILLHPDFWTRRRIMSPSGRGRELPVPSRRGIEGAGFEIIEERQPSFLLDGKLLITGEVDRTTEFEQGMSVHQAFRNGEWEPDPLIHDDQAAVLHVRDKGLVVLTGCGHSGIVNIIRYAKRL